MKKEKVKKLIELANTLDEKGFSKVADEIDKVVEGQFDLINASELVAIGLHYLEAYGGHEELAEAMGELVEKNLVSTSIAELVSAGNYDEAAKLFLTEELKKVGRKKVISLIPEILEYLKDYYEEDYGPEKGKAEYQEHIRDATERLVSEFDL